MALENKKSSLQPSSTQAQQFRLQFSNLAPNGVAPATLTGGLSSPANARPAVSAFVSAPAPVSLAAPATIPPALPAPVPAPAPGPVEIPIVYPTAGVFFDGNTYYSASLDQGNDYLFEINNSYTNSAIANQRRTGIGFYFKPDLGVSSAYPRRTLFHTYSGSFASQSFEIYVAGAYIHAAYTDNNKTYVIRSKGLRTGYTGKSGNGYTYVYFSMPNRNPTNNPANILWYGGFTNQGEVRESTLQGSTFSIDGNDHFYIGGSPLAANNFSGSISNFFYYSGSYDNATQTALTETTAKPESFDKVVRLYKFDGVLTDVTSSLAEYSYPLELVAGTTSYVEGPFTNQN